MAHQEKIQHQIMKKMNPAILALSESRLIPEIADSEVNVPGYSVVRCENRSIGGIILYIRDDIKYEIILREKISNYCCAAVEMKDKGIAVVYHLPSASDGDFMFFRAYSGYIGNERTICTDKEL